MVDPKILFVLSPSLVYFPFPPLAVGTLLCTLRKSNYSVDYLDLHIKLLWHAKDNKHRQQINHALSPPVLQAYFEDEVNNDMTALTEEINTYIPKERFDIVLISTALGQPESYAVAGVIASLFKKNSPCCVVLGGEASQYRVLRRIFPILHKKQIVDFVTNGPGEETIISLVAAMQKTHSLRNVPGLLFFEEGVMTENLGGKEVLCLDPDFTDVQFEGYAWPNRQASILENEHTPHIAPVEILPFRFILGCLFNCAFCRESSNKGVRLVDPQVAVEAISDLAARHKIYNFHFVHPALNTNKKYFESFCKLLIETQANIQWSDCVRADLIDAKLITLAKRAGAIRFVFGLESASKTILNQIDKKLSPDQVALALRQSHEVGIWTALELIVGFPGETQTDLEQTAQFLDTNQEWIDEIWLNGFFLDVRSRMFAESARYNIVEVQNHQANNPFDIYSPPVRFREAGFTFSEQESKTQNAVQYIVDHTSIFNGDAEGFPMVCALFAARGSRAKLGRLMNSYRNIN